MSIDTSISNYIETELGIDEDNWSEFDANDNSRLTADGHDSSKSNGIYRWSDDANGIDDNDIEVEINYDANTVESFDTDHEYYVLQEQDGEYTLVIVEDGQDALVVTDLEDDTTIITREGELGIESFYNNGYGVHVEEEADSLATQNGDTITVDGGLEDFNYQIIRQDVTGLNNNDQNYTLIVTDPESDEFAVFSDLSDRVVVDHSGTGSPQTIGDMIGKKLSNNANYEFIDYTEGLAGFDPAAVGAYQLDNGAILVLGEEDDYEVVATMNGDAIDLTVTPDGGDPIVFEGLNGDTPVIFSDEDDMQFETAGYYLEDDPNAGTGAGGEVKGIVRETDDGHIQIQGRLHHYNIDVVENDDDSKTITFTEKDANGKSESITIDADDNPIFNFRFANNDARDYAAVFNEEVAAPKRDGFSLFGIEKYSDGDVEGPDWTHEREFFLR